MTNDEKSARALLEKGMEVPVTAPSLFRLFGKRSIMLVLPPPSLGTLYNIGEVIERSGLDKALSGEEPVNMQQVRKLYTKPLCRIAALGFINGKFTGWLFARPLGAWLRWHLSGLYLFTIARTMDILRLDESFLNTIRLVTSMNLTKPNLSPKESGS